MGGNPTGDRSTADAMVLLCRHRHQDGAIAIHKGTLRSRPLTAEGTNGPLAWEVDKTVLWSGASFVTRDSRWLEVARESAVQQVGFLSDLQKLALKTLAKMDL